MEAHKDAFIMDWENLIRTSEQEGWFENLSNPFEKVRELRQGFASEKLTQITLILERRDDL